MKWAVVLLTLSFTVAFSTAVAAQAPDEGRILALENAWNQAQLHHDASAVNQLLSEHFVYTDYDGTVMDKAKFLADLKDPSYEATLISNEDMKVYSYKDAAIIIGTYHTKGKYKHQPFEHRGRFTDTWIFVDGTWLCVASHTTLLKNQSPGAAEQ